MIITCILTVSIFKY